MDFAIIAAGEGSRLKSGGFRLAKPMVQLGDLTLVERLIKIFIRNHASVIHIIINDFSPELSLLLSSLHTEVPLNVVTKSTPSSLHSFAEIIPFVKTGKVCLTTVDTVFNEKEFSGYINAFERSTDTDAMMAVTDFIDDESPLYVKTDENLRVTGFYDASYPGARFVSGGIYCFGGKVKDIVEKAVTSGTSRMRNFQRMLLEEGLHVSAYPFSKIVDIDHVKDILTAKMFLAEEEQQIH